MEVLKVGNRWLRREGCFPAGFSSERDGGTDEVGGFVALLAILAGDVQSLEELAQLEPIIEGDVGLLETELRLGNSVLVKLPALNRRSVQRSDGCWLLWSAISAASTASRGQPKGAASSSLRICVPVLPEPIVWRTCWQTGCCSIGPSYLRG